MGKTNIEWCTDVWNPIRGCTRVSEGCRHCYAEVVAARFSGPGQPYAGLATREPARWTGVVREVPERLLDPLRWQRPRRIFVNSMSDLFHESLPDEAIDRVFAVMALAQQHTFQVLTKRPARMLAYLTETMGLTYSGKNVRMPERVQVAMNQTSLPVRNVAFPLTIETWPLPNVWLGVSVEDQATADARIPLMLDTPAAVRWVSAEPLLGELNLHAWLWAGEPPRSRASLDWLVVGGESGPGARPCDVAWLRSLVVQCALEHVPCFVKQLGALPLVGARSAHGFRHARLDSSDRGLGDDHCVLRLRDRKGGDVEEFPLDLRVREFPRGATT